MNKTKMSRRIAAFVVALTFALGLFTGTGLAEATEGCPHHTVHTQECLDENGSCTFRCELCEQEQNVSGSEEGIAVLRDTMIPEDAPVQPEAAEEADGTVHSYSELAASVMSSQSVITIAEDFAAQAQDAWTALAVPAGAQITLDLNGQQLAASAQGAAITVAGEGTALTVIDSKGGAAITAQSAESIFQVLEGASLNILDGIYVLEPQQTRAIDAKGGSVTIGEMNRENLPFITRTQPAAAAPEFGGAVLAAGNAAVTMLGGTISNTSAVNGGAIAVLDDAQLIAHGGAILNSTAQNLGGAVYFAGAEDEGQVLNVRFDGNSPSDAEYATKLPEETPEEAPGVDIDEVTEETTEDEISFDAVTLPDASEIEEIAEVDETEGDEAKDDEESNGQNTPGEAEVSSASELAQAVKSGASKVTLANNIALVHGTGVSEEQQAQFASIARIAALAGTARSEEVQTAAQLGNVELPLKSSYLILDLNGYTLSVAGGSGSSSFIETDGYFELIDTAGDSQHPGTGGTISASNVESIVRAEGTAAAVKLTAGKLLVGNGTQRGVEAHGGAALELLGTTIEGAGESDGFGGGVLVDGAKMNMTGLVQDGYTHGSIRGTKAANGGGIAVLNGGSLTMSAGRIENCAATENGGGIYVDAASTASVGGQAIVANNNAKNAPANIWFENGNYEGVETETGDGSAAAAILQQQITEASKNNGTVAADGQVALGAGLVVPQNGSVTLEVNGTISLGSAAAQEYGSAAAIQVQEGANLVLEGKGTISAQNLAAAIAVEKGGKLTVSGPTVRNAGGEHGIRVTDGTFTMTSGLITGSGKSVSLGGGVYLSGGSHTIEGGAIQANRAQNGGGIYAVNGAQVTLSEAAQIAGNSAARGAGIYLADNAKAFVKAGSIHANTAADFGGGLYAAKGAQAEIANADLIADNTPDQVYAEDGADVSYGAAQSGHLQDVINAAIRANGTIDLSNMPSTIIVNDTIKVESNSPASITLDLDKGRTIRWTGSSDKVLFDVKGQVTLTIDGQGLIEGGGAAKSLIKLNDAQQTLVLKGSTLTNKDGLHAVWSKDAEVEMEGNAAITNSGRTTTAASAADASADTASGSAIFAEGGTVTIKGGTIADNGNPLTTNVDNGTIKGGTKRYGAVYVKNGVLNISGGTFTGNQGLQGGAVAAENTNLTITGGTLGSRARAYSTGNMASWGGALWISNSGGKTASITGGEFAGNNAAEGGAIYIDNGSVSVAGEAKIEYNSAVMGSKMHFNDGATLNNWRGAGGGIYVDGGSLTLGGNAVVAYNNARGDAEANAAQWTGSGGGIAVSTRDKKTNSSGKVTVTEKRASFTMTDSARVEYNTASRFGGGVFVARSTDLKFAGSPKVAGNEADETLQQTYQPNLYVGSGSVGKWDSYVASGSENGQQIDSTEFLGKAEGGRIALEKDTVLNGAVKLEDSLTIDLAGNTLSYEGSAEGKSAMLIVPENTELTIENSVGGQNAGGVLGTNENNLQSLIRLEGPGSKVTLEGGNLTNEIGHAIYAPKGGAVTVDGVDASITNSGSPSAPGGAIMMEGTGAITVEQGTFSGNRALLGGAIYSSAVPDGNPTDAGVEESYSLRIHGGQFTNNTANDGGAVWAQRMWMSGGTIENNRAVWSGGRSGQGGGICITRAEGNRDVDAVGADGKKIMNLMLTGANISANIAEGVGGGIALSWGTYGEIAGKAAGTVRIQSNLAEAKSTDTAMDKSIPHSFAGGGIFIEHRTGSLGASKRYGGLTIHNLLVTDNTAQYGGGIGLCSDGALEIFQFDGASIHGNHINGMLDDEQIAQTLEANKTIRDASDDILGDISTTSAQVGTLSAAMLGTDKANWSGQRTKADGSIEAVNKTGQDADGLYTFGLKNNVPDGPMPGDATARCIISGNESRTGGGGIGGNGGFKAGFTAETGAGARPIPSSPAVSASAELGVRKVVEMPENVTNVPMSFLFEIQQISGPAAGDGEMVKAYLPYSQLKIDISKGSASAEDVFRGIRFPMDGTYTFSITENLTGVDDFWSLTGVQSWTATVTVNGTTENAQKFAVSYAADEDADKTANAAEFVNTYTSPDVFQPRVEKKLVDESGAVEKATFRFELRAKNEAPMPEGAQDDGDGLVSIATVETQGEAFFGSIRYEEAGTFEYTIRELIGEEPIPGMIYDETVWTLTVEVSDVNGSKVITSITYEELKNEEAEEPKGDAEEDIEADDEATQAIAAAGAATFVNRVEAPTPSETPEPSATPSATPAPTPSATPSTTATPSGTPSTTPAPSATPSATTTPGPSNTPAPSSTPTLPVSTPTPSATQPEPSTPAPDVPVEEVTATSTPEIIVGSRPDPSTSAAPSALPTSETAAGEPEWPSANAEPTSATISTSEPSAEPTSETMAGEPEWPSEEPTSDTAAAEPEWPGEEITIGAQEYPSYDTGYEAPGTVGTISSVNGSTGSPSVVANTDGTIGSVPKTDDGQSLGLWLFLAMAGIAGSAAGLLGWKRAARRAIDR